MTTETVSIRISKHLHDQLRAISDETGIPIKRLADRAIATQLATKTKTADGINHMSFHVAGDDPIGHDGGVIYG